MDREYIRNAFKSLEDLQVVIEPVKTPLLREDAEFEPVVDDSAKTITDLFNDAGSYILTHEFDNNGETCYLFLEGLQNGESCDILFETFDINNIESVLIEILDSEHEFIDSLNASFELDAPVSEVVAAANSQLNGEEASVEEDPSEEAKENVRDYVGEEPTEEEPAEPELPPVEVEQEPVEESLIESQKFNIQDDEDMKEADELLNKEEEPVEQIIDANAEITDDLRKTYIGSAILQCPTCKAMIYKNPDELVKSEDSDADEVIYNVEEECPRCGAKDGFELIGQVAALDVNPDAEPEAPMEEPQEEAELEIEEPAPQPEPMPELPQEEKQEEGLEEDVDPETSKEDSIPLAELAETVDRKLAEEKRYYEVWYDDNSILVEVNWGDWKHDHNWLDSFVKKLLKDEGYDATVSVQETEEDGSDCYSAIHSFLVSFDKGNLEEDIDTSKLDIDDVIGWISDHDELYNDFKEYFSYEYDEASGEEKNKPSLGKIIDWLFEHDQAFEDFKSYFEVVDESLKEDVDNAEYHITYFDKVGSRFPDGENFNSLEDAKKRFKEQVAFYERNGSETIGSIELTDENDDIIDSWENDALNEDTIKQGNKWVNKGKEGTHGEFKTKKAADAQRKAMFANGYKEGLEEDVASETAEDTWEDIKLTTEEKNMLDKLTHKNKMDGWFWIDDENDCIRDLEDHNKKLNTCEAILLVNDGTVDIENFLNDEEIKLFKDLVSRCEVSEKIRRSGKRKMKECDNSTDIQLEGFDTNRYDRLVSRYLKETYTNVKSYKTTSASVADNANTIILEGNINFKSGVEKPTKFVFEAKELNKKNQLKLIGSNTTLTEGKAFTLLGSIKNKTLLSESFAYKYKVNDTKVKGKIAK